MFTTRAVKRKLNRLHERGLIALLNDETSTFNVMLSKTNDTIIHVKHIQIFMIEFSKHLPFGLPNPKTKKYGTDTIAYKATQLWSTLLARYKNLSQLDLFKSEIKK